MSIGIYEFARVLHEATRCSEVKTFIDWEDLTTEARERRCSQAEYILERYEILEA